MYQGDLFFVCFIFECVNRADVAYIIFIWCYSFKLMYTYIGLHCKSLSYRHILHFTFHIRAVMLPWYKAPHPSRVPENKWWMVTPPGWSLHGWSYLINMLVHGALCLSTHRVENLIDTPNCTVRPLSSLLQKHTFPFLTHPCSHMLFLTYCQWRP